MQMPLVVGVWQEVYLTGGGLACTCSCMLCAKHKPEVESEGRLRSVGSSDRHALTHTGQQLPAIKTTLQEQPRHDILPRLKTSLRGERKSLHVRRVRDWLG